LDLLAIGGDWAFGVANADWGGLEGCEEVGVAEAVVVGGLVGNWGGWRDATVCGGLEGYAVLSAYWKAGSAGAGEDGLGGDEWEERKEEGGGGGTHCVRFWQVTGTTVYTDDNRCTAHEKCETRTLHKVK